MRQFIILSILIIFLTGCGSVSGQLQILSPADATALAKESERHVQGLPTLTPAISQTIPMQTASLTPEALAEPTRIPFSEMAVTPWEQLFDRNLVADEQWELYTGELQGEKGYLRTFTIPYPDQWYVTSNADPSHFSVQNISETAGGEPVSGDFIKLEILFYKGSFAENASGEEKENGEEYKVLIDGEPTMLWMGIGLDQTHMITVELEKDGVNYILSGYVNLMMEDQVSLDYYRTLLLSMLSSFQISPSPEETSQVTITGIVMDVSLSARVIILTQPVSDITSIALTDETTILYKSGNEATLQEITNGMQIQATGEPGSPKSLIATQIVLLE
ncbi:MAG: hypothetical protein WA110_00535 [Anaerolineaceae bacterium]